MKYDQTTPAPVEVTQADRDRAAKFISESDGDFAELAALFAAHRIAHSAPAGEVEPVAWMYEREDRVDGYMFHISLDRFDAEYAASQDYAETPLFRHPPAQDVEALVEALEPFAKAAQIKLFGGDYWTDDKRIQSTDTAFHITFGDLRRARAALAKHGGA